MSPDLSQLLRLVEEMPAYSQLIDEIKDKGNNTKALVLDAAKPYLVAALYQNLAIPMLIVTAEPENSKSLCEQLLVWSNSSQIKLFPEPDALPYQRIAPDPSTEMERIQILSSLTNTASDKKTPLIVTSALALVQKTMPRSNFALLHHTIKPGMSIEPLQLLQKWAAMGYQIENLVETPGAISHRGGIIDIYPPTSNLPVRLEFFGNAIDSIRLFDPSSQRSLEKLSSAAIGPATELPTNPSNDKLELELLLNNLDLSSCTAKAKQQFRQDLAMLVENQKPPNMQFYAPLFSTDNLLSYLPQNTLLILDKPQTIKQATDKLDFEAAQLRSQKIARGELPPNFPSPCFTWPELEPLIQERKRLTLNTWGTYGDEQTYRLNFSLAPSFAGRLPSFMQNVKQWLNREERLIIVSHQATRLSELLNEEGIIASPLTEIDQIPPSKSLTLVQGLLAGGWVMNNATYLLTDSEIFGFIKQRRLTKKHPVPHHKLSIDISPGGYVVHIEHGIGKFAGVTNMSTDGSEREYLVLHYAAGDKLYVPTDQIDRVSRYISGGKQPPVLSRLGTQEWTQAKRRVKESVENLAQELLALYATREVVPGFTFSQDTVWQQELEASFPYIETPDQIAAQEEIKEDMTKAKPMDRLVCGDVGYGKTEIALRAAFKAVMDNKQVAILVPTTVLAQQHFTTFSQRLSAFPIRIEMLSRFRTPKDQRATINDLASGKIDICIGTHRLLQKDVTFKDLGLLIIDEEQRFGVIHKEHFKQMRREIDVLALSATPIPRTLHMSLVGVRDMSTLETPPDERLPIKTHVAEYDDQLIREAVIRELERNGQVFFVHNRVQSIALAADKLQLLLPEARIVVAHGQMPETELEVVMADFAQGKSDILVCTTIIESGLDMPNVNTLIVNQADKLGLTQLYQLRGRVGRGANLAYAYFLYDRGKQITSTAEKRLRTIFEATELGAGFNIAMRDLEIRGAGTLLGAKQSGYISAVGFNLYCRLLTEAIEGQKGKLSGLKETREPSRLPPPIINLPLSAYIPEEYVSDTNIRLKLYQRLVNIETTEQVTELTDELQDRFGVLLPEVANLLYATKIRALATRAGIESISTEQDEIVIRRFQGTQFDRRQLESFSQTGVRIGNTHIRVNPKQLRKRWQTVLERILRKIS